MSFADFSFPQVQRDLGLSLQEEEYYIDNVGKIVGILRHILETG
jgi:hypothetical protein